MFIDSYDIQTENEDDDKYYSFVGHDWVWMTMSPEDEEWCRKIGAERRKFGQKNKMHNLAKNPGVDTEALGVAGELAIHRYTGQKINQLGV